MASNTYNMNTWGAKRIFGDTHANLITDALLQITANNTWILSSGRQSTYGIKYVYDSSTDHDKIELYGGYQVSSADVPTAWVQLDTGDVYILGQVGINHAPDTYQLYVDGTSYFDDDITVEGNVVPNQTNTYTLGTSSLRWSKLYVGTADSYGSTTQPIYWNAGVPGILGTIGGQYEPVWVDDGTVTAITAGTTGQFYRGDKTWSNVLTGDISLGSREVTSGPSSVTYSNRITIVPYFHTGGPWYIKSGDDSSNAYLALYYNTTQLMRIKHDGTQMIDWKGNVTGSSASCTGNAATATALSTSGTTAKFWRGDNTWSDTISGGTLKITANGNTVTIGSQNTGWCHIQNSANIPFYFNKTTAIDGELGTTSYPVKNIYIGKANGAGIYYQGSKANYRMIRFIDNATDTYGNGVSIGGGGQTIIGGGESADTAAAQVGTGGSEIMYVCNDGQIDFYSNLQNGWSSGKHSYMDTSGNFITANNLAVAGSAGNGYGLSLYNGAGNVQNYGIWCGLASTYGNFGQVTNDWNMYFGMAGNRYRGWVFRGPGGAKASINTYGEFSGRAIHMYPGGEITNSYNEGARFHVSSGGWATIMLCGSDNTGATGTSAKSWGIFNNDGTLYINRATSSGAGVSRAYANSNGWYFDKAYGAVWNDFAEFRQSDVNEPGRVIVPSNDGVAHLSTKRLQSGCRIISDTYGFSVGASDKAKTPVGISGRVLAYPYQKINKYKIGDAVCSAPNGTVDIMTRNEIKKYPERIIGIVNEIPNYEIWEETLECPGGEPSITKIEVKGRIWIDIK